MRSERGTTYLLAAILAISLIAAVGVSAQTRVNFRRGMTTIVFTGKLSNYNQKRVFVVRVLRGQSMKIRDVGNNAVSIWVQGPPHSGYQQDLAADCHGRSDVSPTVAGDYKLTIQECQKADRWRGVFKVRVTVR
jgi:hypothetical protein